MVIVGKTKETFAEANYARISKFNEDGGWHPVSTNHDWELFWSELDDYDGDTVTLQRWGGVVEIQQDSHGEYIEIEQEHRGMFARGTYRTRFRPYREKRTEIKPWMDLEDD